MYQWCETEAPPEADATIPKSRNSAGFKLVTYAAEADELTTLQFKFAAVLQAPTVHAFRCSLTECRPEVRRDVQ
jgi:hypothetical protein